MSKYLCLVSLLLAVATVNSITITRLSSKSTYEDVNAHPQPLKIPDDHIVERAFLVTRHGSAPLRNEPRNLITMNTLKTKINNKIEALENGIENSGVTDELRNFLGWNGKLAEIPPQYTNILPQGINELQGIANRLKLSIPELFNKEYDPQTHAVLSIPQKQRRWSKSKQDWEAGENRCLESAQVFLEALFLPRKFDLLDIPVCAQDDLTLMMEHGRSIDTDFNKGMLKGREKYFRLMLEKSDPYISLRQNFAERLQLEYEDITFNEIKAALETCRCERLNAGVAHPTCQLFTDPEAQLMLSIDHDYWDGFHDFEFIEPHSGKLACGMAVHLFLFLQNDKLNPNVSLMVGHRGGNLFFNRVLDLQSAFDSSDIVAHSANFLVGKFKHKDTGNYVVGVYLNEKIRAMSCGQQGFKDLCPLPIVIEKLRRHIEKFGCNDMRRGAKEGQKAVYDIPTWYSEGDNVVMEE